MDRGLGSRYVLHEPIGRGAYGDVWRASPRAGGPPLAVKVLKPELASDDETVGRFLQERSILVGLEHPNLVRVHDLVIEGDTIAIVMDLAAGTDLRRLLSASPTQAPALACEVARQIAAGLAAVHAGGVVHRDVKPENVMVDLSSPGLPLARLTDFGIARLTQSPSVTRMSGIMGTPEYIAPELAGRSAATPAADVYSLGILLYELCVGRTPFGGGHPVAVLRRHMDVAPPRPDGVPDRLWDLIAGLLAKDPAGRPSAAAAAAALAVLAPTLSGMAPLPPMAEADEDDWPVPAPGPAAPAPAPLDRTAIPLSVAVARRSPGAAVRRRRHRGRPLGRPDAGIAGGGGRFTPSGWPLLFGGPLLVALVVLGGLTWARQPDAEPVTDFLFNGELLEDKELLIGRKWTLSADGDTVFGFLTITNYSERETFGGTYEEVLPREMAPDPRAVTSRPPVEGNPGDAAGHSVLRYQIADKLSPRSKLNIAYSLAVGPEAAEDGLERWAEQRVEAVEDYNAWAEANAQDAQEIPVRLASFDILTPSPVRLNLETPALRLDVRGTLDNGQPAPPLVLALIEWTSDDAAVVEVAGGALAPGRPGTTTVRARSGTLERTVEVIVTERGRVTASPAPQPAPLISQDRDFPVVPAPGATARPAPTQPPPTALPPTSRVTTTTTPPTTPSTTTPPRPDGDGDGVPDESDNCPSVPNPDQINSDGVGSGDACDADGDGYSDDFDNCPSVANDQVDTDGTGGGDACDPDDDGDGVEDSTDNCRTVANVDQVDTDDDLIGNACDDDRDGDGIPNDGDPFPDDRANQGSTSTSGVTDLSTTTS